MKIEEKLYFTQEHEWIDIDGEIAMIGITTFAQSELGDIVFIEFPEIGDSFKKGDTLGTIEAVKTVADLYAPISGEIIELNSALEDNAEIINSDPFGKGWIIKMKLNSSDEIGGLLSYNNYKKLVE